ncbi:MAG: rhamnogalacturonan acetylesterase [Kofleriaceae bacterium]|nr:rhamnogalacturonan acetylesterase [Kofleriaceae bacterium]
MWRSVACVVYVMLSVLEIGCGPGNPGKGTVDARATVPDADNRPTPVVTVMVGDSTMATFDDPPPDRPTLTGWGQVFGDYFDTLVSVHNMAVSGESSRSYVDDGYWDAARTQIDTGTFVFIQFGHNDQSDDARHTDPATTYRDQLVAMVSDTIALGGVPILVSPVARRTFVDGELVDTLQPYADGARAVAESRGTAFVDLHALSMALYVQLGAVGSEFLSASAVDTTHFSRDGAIAIAGLVVENLPAPAASLAEHRAR